MDKLAAVKRKRSAARAVAIGRYTVGAGNPVAVQSMCATRTRDIDATVAQIRALSDAGAAIVRVAVDSDKDVEALREIRAQVPSATLAVDLQEGYRLASRVGPLVSKMRYNPGHLHHVDKEQPVAEKVRWLVDIANDSDCAIRIGVNCGSVEPDLLDRYREDRLGAMIESARVHCKLMERLGFERFVVSLKDSDPMKVVEANRRFAALEPRVPLHLGVTEAGLPPEGIIKTRWALMNLLADGIGDTIRVSLTLSNQRKSEEVEAGLQILEDLSRGQLAGNLDQTTNANIVSCPSCSRVENEGFVALAEEVRNFASSIGASGLTIAVMGCRVNGPGETDEADIGLWCGPKRVNLKLKSTLVGTFTYGEVMNRVKEQIEALQKRRGTQTRPRS